MTRKDDIDIRIHLRELNRFVRDTNKGSKAVRGVGTEADRAGKKAKGAERGLNMFRKKVDLAGKSSSFLSSKMKKLVGAAAGIGAAFASIGAAKGAVDTTVELGKSTLFLNRSTGMTIKQSSQLAAVAKSRNIEQKALNMALGTLSKRYVDAMKKGSPVLKIFKKLGITQKDLTNTGGDFNKLLTLVADGFGGMEGGARRTSAGMMLMGRGWQTLLPLFSKGSKTLNEQRMLADEYGATFSNMSAKEVKQFIAAQREAKFATLGLQVAFGTKVAPTLTKIILAVSRFTLAWRKNKGAAGDIRQALETKVIPILRVLWRVTRFVATNIGKAFKDIARDVRWVINAWNNTVNFVKKVPGRMAAAGRGMWNWVKSGFKGSLNWVIDKWNALEFHTPRVGFGPFKTPSISVGTPNIPRLGSGGTALTGGTALVGDRGPEIMSMPQGASVRPLTREERVQPIAGLRAALAGGSKVIKVPVYLNRRQIAEATAEYHSDVAARR